MTTHPEDTASRVEGARSVPNPGSDEAVARGCTCPVLDNARGRGAAYNEGTFWINDACPLHALRQGADDHV